MGGFSFRMMPDARQWSQSTMGIGPKLSVDRRHSTPLQTRCDEPELGSLGGRVGEDLKPRFAFTAPRITQSQTGHLTESNAIHLISFTSAPQLCWRSGAVFPQRRRIVHLKQTLSGLPVLPESSRPYVRDYALPRALRYTSVAYQRSSVFLNSSESRMRLKISSF